ncbi:MAG: FMN-binding protein [Phycisphaerales bacterium]|jgi:Na+-translocating ferredoxin:NAD+ oxidoreductase subunit G|nr:FMN-binding protein [Phycisphaerales bacterium]MBT7170375.1 FMN-binding protein [Phycisphaerales bacterium]
MLNYIKQGSLVIVLALLFGAALAAVQAQLKPLIEENQKLETLDAIPMLMVTAQALPTEDTIAKKTNAKTMEIQITGQSADGEAMDFIESVVKMDLPASPKTKLFEVKVREATAKAEDAKVIGYVIQAAGMGFGDKIVTLVGVDATCQRITGVYILDQKETPGLGDKICGAWAEQFSGMVCSKKLKVYTGSKRSGDASQTGAIHGISAATISSEAVTKIVNDAVAEIRAAIGPALEQLQAARAAKVRKDLLLATPGATSLKGLSSNSHVAVDPETMSIEVTTVDAQGKVWPDYTQKVREITTPSGAVIYEVKTIVPAVAKLLKMGTYTLERLPVTAYMIHASGAGDNGVLVAVESQCKWVLGITPLDAKTANAAGTWVETFKGANCKDALKVIQPGTKIDATSSATMEGYVGVCGKSDPLLKTVTKTVNQAVAELRAALASIKAKGGK